MIDSNFSQRLAQLRMTKVISARDMSLSIGQNPGYINTIENGKAYPTMTNFFYICDYLKITPQEFFDYNNLNPIKNKEINVLINKLNEKELESLIVLLNEIVKDR